jgi:hypothetical protein
MSEELVAVPRAPSPVTQGEYDAICAALMQTERGRWFLQEYARRNRSADTKLLLDAIGRIEAVVCADHQRQTQQSFRSDLLEMAEAISRTRAEVAEIPSDQTAPPAVSAATEPSALPGPRSGDVFVAAERIRDVTWAMRGHGFDPATCEQLEELAALILSATALRDPADHRASKLAEVLGYLERRIGALLESGERAEAAEPNHAPQTDAEAGAAEPAVHRNGSAVAFAASLPEDGAAEVATAAPIRIPTLPAALHDDLEGEWGPSPPVELAAPVSTLAVPKANGAEPALPNVDAAARNAEAPALSALEPALHFPAASPGALAAETRSEPIAEAPLQLVADASLDGHAKASSPGAEPAGIAPIARAADEVSLASEPELAAEEARQRTNGDTSCAGALPRNAALLAPTPPAATLSAPDEDPLAVLKAMSEEELVALFT